MNPGWALDRLDQTYTFLNNQYNYPYDGTGRKIYILDTGLNLANNLVSNEFGGRATILYDVNGENGNDCYGHGTSVASAAAGKVYGVAKNATLLVGKISVQCSGNAAVSTMIMAFNWLASNAPRGSIVNLSFGVSGCSAFVDTALEKAIRAAYNSGVIVVIAAGNYGCDTANSSFTKLPEAFVVGASQNKFLYNFQKDAMAVWSSTQSTNYGANVAGFAPGQDVLLMSYTGNPVASGGTSFAAPYVAGLFAAGCHATVNFCDTIVNAGVAYQALKNNAVTGSVVTSTNSSTLPAGTASRFFVRNAW